MQLVESEAVAVLVREPITTRMHWAVSSLVTKHLMLLLQLYAQTSV